MEIISEVIKRLQEIDRTFLIDNSIEDEDVYINIEYSCTNSLDASIEVLITDYKNKTCDEILSFVESEISNYVECYDIDYQCYMWLDDSGHGKNGAPFHIQDILDDCKECLSKYEDFLNRLSNERECREF